MSRWRRPHHNRIETQLNRMEHTMSEISADQQHLEDDVTAIKTSIATAVAELKAQIAAGVPASSLDFTSLDGLAADTAAEAAADAPPVPPVV